MECLWNVYLTRISKTRLNKDLKIWNYPIEFLLRWNKIKPKLIKPSPPPFFVHAGGLSCFTWQGQTHTKTTPRFNNLKKWTTVLSVKGKFRLFLIFFAIENTFEMSFFTKQTSLSHLDWITAQEGTECLRTNCFLLQIKLPPITCMLIKLITISWLKISRVTDLQCYFVH